MELTKEIAKNTLSILNNINSIEELNIKKEELRKFLKEENKKPKGIEVKWVGCYELMKEGTQEIYYKDAKIS